MGGLIEVASRRRLVGAGLLAAVTALVVSIGLGLGVLGNAQAGLSDLLFPSEGGDPGTVVVGVDTSSVRAHGQWPWPRALQARLVSALHTAGAKAIVLDAIYDLPGNEDAELAAAIREAGTVVVAATVSPRLHPGRLPSLGDDINTPVPAIAEAAAAAGFADVQPDAGDGVVRAAPLVASDEKGDILPSLSYAAFSLLAGQDPGAITVRPSGLQAAERLIPTDDRKLMRIDFSSRFASWKSAGHISAGDVLAGRMHHRIKGKVAFVGITDPLGGDRKRTPLDKGDGTSGVLIQAQAFQTMWGRTFVTPVSAWETLAWAILLAFGAALAGMGRRLWTGAPVALAALVAYLVLATMRFEAAGSQMDLLWPPAAAGLGAVSTIGLRYVAERLKVKRVEARLDHVRLSTVPDVEEIHRLAQFAELKDDDTGIHIIRVGSYAKRLALAAGLKEEEAEMLFHASKLHDMGKIGVADAVLRKPGKLTDEEWVIMRQHPENAAKRLRPTSSPMIKMAEQIAYAHHEKWNGSGYPRGLEGEDIPLVGRITAIADVFDALTSRRPYKEPMPPEKALEIILKDAGTHFDPRLAKLFKTIFPDILELMEGFAAQEAEQLKTQA